MEHTGYLREQGCAFDAQRTGGLTVELRTHLPLGQQAQVLGAAWLDVQLIGGGRELTVAGFGAQAHEIMWHRADFLVEQGLAGRQKGRSV